MKMEREIEAKKTRMELKEEEESEPVSPTAQYLSSSTLSLCILAILEFEQVLDDSLLMQLVKDVFLSISPRFSSVMVTSLYLSF